MTEDKTVASSAFLDNLILLMVSVCDWNVTKQGEFQGAHVME